MKKKKLLGYDFHRQKPIDNYIVDFFCYKLMLAIEVDGNSHVFKVEYDQRRQRRLEELGINFLRFDALLIKMDLESVLKTIETWIEENK